ncbi:carbamate kinase [Pseudolactococcus plantarum]|uniref:Carbamate kinase n=1 Tax=Pseudolactococcus plantarum TaxID=1365 RepID=A0A2A5RXQ9_9LACT|nr:carbamate kinase [Lactococcus plantarum]PCS06031.1 carbamate kinase [Lactococcus plantarum]HCN74109.1 carbamate kinase [Lactococcus sp.]
MGKRIVVALGGNAILTDDPSASAQAKALQQTAEQLMPLIKDNDVEMVVTHGNGPQVGNLLLQQLESDSDKNPAMPLDTAVAMTQGEIGYWMLQAFTAALNHNDMSDVPLVSVITRTVVDPADEAFDNPTKPIGPFYTESEATLIKAQYPEWKMIEDSGRGYRRVVASPLPLKIVEAKAIKPLLDASALVTVCGGGGIPVIESDTGYEGVEAVIDKDFSASKLAELVEADELVILTSVGDVFLNFGKPNQQALGTVSVSDMRSYLNQGLFAAGSMKPKVAAAVSFVENTGKKATITSLDNVENFVKHGSGTCIIPD